MARITGTKEDTAGHTRYYKASYRKDGTKNEKSVVRTARSLVFILRPDDQEDEQQAGAELGQAQTMLELG